MASEIEKSGYEIPPTEMLYRQRALVTASITASMMFLEATINEVFADAQKSWFRIHCAGLTNEKCSALCQAWTNVKRRPVLDKYYVALKAVGAPDIPKNDHIYSDVKSVVELRNYITHFDGKELRDRGCDEHPLAEKDQHQIEKCLRGKFELCTFSGLDFFFPDQCLGASCSIWACMAVHRFVREFSRKVGIVELYSENVT